MATSSPQRAIFARKPVEREQIKGACASLLVSPALAIACGHFALRLIEDWSAN
jgi:hypothetical protein